MILLNFSRPLNDSQHRQLEMLINGRLDQEIELLAQFNEQEPFAPQTDELLNRVLQVLTAHDGNRWKSRLILVVLPEINNIASLLLAKLYSQLGYFPSLVRVQPVANVLSRRYKIAEIIDLQAVAWGWESKE